MSGCVAKHVQFAAAETERTVMDWCADYGPAGKYRQVYSCLHVRVDIKPIPGVDRNAGSEYENSFTLYDVCYH